MSEEMQGIGALGEQIERLTQDGIKTAILKLPERDGVYAIVNRHGIIERRVAEPGWHQESLASPAELMRHIRELPEAARQDGIVFISREKITFAYDRNDRRHTASCPLAWSPQYTKLVDLYKSRPQMTQKQLVSLLRIDLRNCLASENLLPLIRKLNFNASASGNSEVAHGRESMGKSITASVMGTDAIPEETKVTIPVFENHVAPVVVDCAIEIQTTEQTFQFFPFPLSLQKAMDQVMEGLLYDFSTMGAGMPPAYLGTM